MAAPYYDRVRETTTTTGTGDVTTAGAVTGFVTFDSVFGHAGTFFEYVISSAGSEWEVGIGHLSASTTLVRGTVIASSNAGAAVNFSAGIKDVRGTVASTGAPLVRDLKLTAQGLVGETFPRQSRGLTVALVAGTVYYGMCALRRNDVVTNIIVNVTTASAAATLSKLALYKKDGTQLGVTTSQHVAWNAGAGLFTVALTAAYIVPADDAYYLALVSVGGTPPVVLSNGLVFSAGQATAVGSGKPPLGVQTGQTDMPSPGTITGGTTGAGVLWLGAS